MCVCVALKVLALVFIRKLLDFFFTKRELSWLDDVMPESKKKKEDDKKKKAREKLVMRSQRHLAVRGWYSMVRGRVTDCSSQVQIHPGCFG